MFQLNIGKIFNLVFFSSKLINFILFRVIITQVLGELQFNFYHRWFDVIFLVSALSSIAFMYVAHQQKQIAEKHIY